MSEAVEKLSFPGTFLKNYRVITQKIAAQDIDMVKITITRLINRSEFIHFIRTGLLCKKV